MVNNRYGWVASRQCGEGRFAPTDSPHAKKLKQEKFEEKNQNMMKEKSVKF
jgi:hypothetical protein